MSFYTYYQKTPESSWIPALDDLKEQVIREQKAPFSTVLALDTVVTEEMTSEDLAKIKYRGPFYADFDSPAEDRETVIERFKFFLGKLEKMGISLDQVELYASGGKGFHLLIPQKIFLQKPPTGGIVFLPLIYKEIAQSLYVNTLDMVVYSARKGRMFRTANIERTNGKYKVAITPEEAMTMTPEKYDLLTSAPRPLPVLADPVFCNHFATTFSVASDKITVAVKARGQFKKLNEKLMDKFKGEFPASMVSIMQGNTKAGIGFQNLAVQLACAANDLGKSEDELIAACEGLVNNHVSDGIRYNSPAKRVEELRRMIRYTKDHPGYSFSAGGLKSCAKEGEKCLDLEDGFPDMPATASASSDAPQGGGEEAIDMGMAMGMAINRTGIWRKIEGIRVKVCDLGMENPLELVELESGGIIGYEIDMYLRGKPLGKRMLELAYLQNKTKFQQFTSTLGASMQTTDNHTSALIDLLNGQAAERGRVYTVGQEGVDIVTVKGLDGEYTQDHIYASKDGVISLNDQHNYRLRSLYSGERGNMDCDIHTAPALQDTPESRDFFKRFFTLNSPAVVARCLGWYLSAFISPMIRNKFDQYPLLQVAGPAGAGKSKYTDLMMALHYYRLKPKIFSASNITAFALDSTLNSSSSVPIVFDELKSSEIQKSMHDKLRTAFRANYNGRVASKGRVDHSKTKDALSTAALNNRAPLSFIGESLESQTAIVDRCVIVQMTEGGRDGTRDDFEFCLVNKNILSQFGRSCMEQALRINIAKMTDALLTLRKRVQDQMPKRANVDRPAFNYSVVLLGLDFGASTMRSVFGDAFDEVFGTTFEDLKQSLFDNLGTIIPRNMSEASKVLQALSHLSKEGRDGDTKLQFGEDYVFWRSKGGRESVDIKLRVCYDKYRRYVRSLNEEPLYPNFEAMLNGLREHPAVTSRTCSDNVEFKGGGMGQTVFRFDLEKLYRGEGVEEFDMIPASPVILDVPT